ncbi:MAG: Glu-tRNA(Gln) amidotransferase GatDE subunit D [Candidatus Hecatellales archaeon]|nr:MAG: Glu-tRNA(Gln) amidotransferase GatDE subunit D [Candidatus Hecatellales archaeon]
MESLQGYRGLTLKLLRDAGVKVRDHIRVYRGEDVFEGILMPRIELGEKENLVIKLANGYNVGVRVTSQTKIEKVEVEEKPNQNHVEFKVEEKEGLPEVYILGTGGTIASRVEYRTGAVYPSLTTEDLYRSIPELSNLAKIKTKVLFNIFSENMTPKHWSEIAKTTAKILEEEKVNGVIIAHGTDTMGYTASALSFALQNPPTPIILVGSQRSSDRPSSDAALNLIGAVRAAAYAPFAEVTVAMHEWVADEAIVFHRGTKVRKCHTSRRDAFQSINTKPIAKMVENKIVMLTEDYRRRGEGELTLKPDFDERVALLKFYPGFNPQIVEWLIEQKYLGIVFEGTGLGHVGKYCFDSIKKAVDSGLVVAMTSQCIWGSIRMTVYDTGRDLLSLGVIPLKDMLPETALVKMMWSFGQTKNPEKVKELMLKNIAGEYSERLPL